MRGAFWIWMFIMGFIVLVMTKHEPPKLFDERYVYGVTDGVVENKVLQCTYVDSDGARIVQLIFTESAHCDSEIK